MLHIRDSDQKLEAWRDGVETRMYVSSVTGARQLTVFEQWCAPGRGAPLHIHAVEEVLRVLEGQAHITVDREDAVVEAGESVIIPAGVPHSFVNKADMPLHTLAILAAPIFEVSYLESGRDNRRWGPALHSGDNSTELH
ncbi:MAG TPA: cupin domain-containing protein [Thermomicrobiales bacterium]|nr:cupin domain-containing protein [Thermomicrobiales bacterium]